MTKEIRNDLTPQGYIRRLFAETRDGELSITYDPFTEAAYTRAYKMDWTAQDAELVVQHYDRLTTALARIGTLHHELEDKANREKLLTAEELEIWNTYVRPYDPFEVDLAVIYEIHERGQFGDLLEEEEALWKRYCMWREEQSQQRIPFNRRSAADMIQCARQYEKLISLHAPEAAVVEVSHRLAEEMVLYYGGKEEPIVWE